MRAAPDRGNNTPFHVTAELRLCKCGNPVTNLGRYKRYDRAEAEASGYWNVFLEFFGNHVSIVFYSIVDVRDGTVLWINGRTQQKERDNGPP